MPRLGQQLPLLLEVEREEQQQFVAPKGCERWLIEDPSFPFEDLSSIAEAESWRKEISRPPYHLHKWWAQRLGSVFRALIIASAVPPGEDLLGLFFSPVRLPGRIVFDPFMGSGTTVGEALKLGAYAIGRDINPVAVSAVKTALRLPDRGKIVAAYREIEADVARRLRPYYMTQLADGTHAEVLYYFWVKQLPCPHCDTPVDLFSTYVFARHAYPRRHPAARTVCPGCGSIAETRFDATTAVCSSCGREYDPHQGPVAGAMATCDTCHERFKIVDVVKALGQPPSHRLYAKLVLAPDGTKTYLAADDSDRCLYRKAEAALLERVDPYPLDAIAPGYNTNQAIRYGYKYWFQMFNARQLLGISVLAEAIARIQDQQLRETFLSLLSGALEFNNMFTSYKGEGTGAVRHLFSHHILKPERTPLEANLWGTPKSSGSFSTLFRRRLLPAIDYCENPFELRPRDGKSSEKVFGLSAPMRLGSRDGQPFGVKGELSCGDSASAQIADKHVDLVVTDPPFFDNVHYSELADFFYVWQCHWLKTPTADGATTTRSSAEVQHTGVSEFMDRLGNVWKECNRVLSDEGLLVFTYHHSRQEGWHALLESLVSSGFRVVQVHPVKSEMSVATPKHQSREPIDYDVVFVCRKTGQSERREVSTEHVVGHALRRAAAQVSRLVKRGRRVGRGDVRVLLQAHVVAELSRWNFSPETVEVFKKASRLVEMRGQQLL
jgi:putative DNA methylase